MRTEWTPEQISASESERDSRLADDLELLAEERDYYGDAREAGVYRARARAVRAGIADPGWS